MIGKSLLQLGGHALRDYVTAVEDGDAVGQAVSFLEVLRGEEDGHPGRGQARYQFKSTEALMNAAMMDSIADWGEELQRAMVAEVDPEATPSERFEAYWSRVLGSFDTHRELWAATLEILSQVGHAPELRDAIAEGLHQGRLLWAQLIQNIDAATDEKRALAVGSLYQALLSGVIVQWLMDPERAPSSRDLADALRIIAASTGPDAAAATAGKREVKRRRLGSRSRP